MFCNCYRHAAFLIALQSSNVTWMNIKSGFIKFGPQSGSRPCYFIGQSDQISRNHVFYKMSIVIRISYFRLISAHYCFLKCGSMFACVIIIDWRNGQWLDVDKCFIILSCSIYNDNNVYIFYILTLIYIIFNSPSKDRDVYEGEGQACLLINGHQQATEFIRSTASLV